MIPLLPDLPPSLAAIPAGASGAGAPALANAGPGGAIDFASLLGSALPPEPPAAPVAPLLPTGRILPQAGASLPVGQVPDVGGAERAVPTLAGDADETAPKRPIPFGAELSDPPSAFHLPVSHAAPVAMTAPAGPAPESGEIAAGEPSYGAAPPAMAHSHAHPVAEDVPGTAPEPEPEPAPDAIAPTLAPEPLQDRPDDVEQVSGSCPTAPVPGTTPTLVAMPFDRPAATPPATMPREVAATPPVSLPAEAKLAPAAVPADLLRFAPAAPPNEAGEMPVAALRSENPAHSAAGLSLPLPAFAAGATEDAAAAAGAALLPPRSTAARRAGAPLDALRPVMPDSALLTGPAAASADAPPIESAAAPQPPSALSAPSVPTAPLLLAAAAPPPASAPLVEARAETPAAAPQQQSTIEQLGDLREAMRAQRPAMVLNHAEFGAVSMRLEAGGSEGWRAVLASRDPAFVPAIQQALAERAVAAAASPESGLSGGQQGASHNGTGEPRSGTSPSGGQGGSQPYFGQSGSRDGEAAPDHRRPSTAAALAARTEAEDGGPAGSTPQSGGLFA